MATKSSSVPTNASKITASLPAHVRARIDEAAAWKGVSVSTFIVEAARKEAEQVIEKEWQIELARDDAELIISLLENPPRPNAALRKAARHYKSVIGG